MTDHPTPAESSLPPPIPAILLAGGQARRMGGGDKCLRLLGGRPILAHVIDRVRPQVAALVLNANGDPARFAAFDLPVVADDIDDQPGPLAGILAGLDWAALHMPEATYALSVSTDCPFLPKDLVVRLWAAVADGADIALAASIGRTHPVIALWRVALRQDLRHAVTVADVRKVERFCDRHRAVAVNFAGAENVSAGIIDPFFNANTPEDLAAAELLWAQSNNR